MPDADILPILEERKTFIRRKPQETKIPFKKNVWSEDEVTRLIESIRKHGFDWDKITVEVKTHEKKVCQKKWETIRSQLEKDPSLPDADLLSVQ